VGNHLTKRASAGVNRRTISLAHASWHHLHFYYGLSFAISRYQRLRNWTPVIRKLMFTCERRRSESRSFLALRVNVPSARQFFPNPDRLTRSSPRKALFDLQTIDLSTRFCHLLADYTVRDLHRLSSAAHACDLKGNRIQRFVGSCPQKSPEGAAVPSPCLNI